MNNDKQIDSLIIKKRELKLLKIFVLFLSSILTLVGTISLVSFIMFLNSYFAISYFSCFLMAIILPNIYSVFINTSLNGIDDKIKKLQNDIDGLENKDNIIKSIEIRFEGLSNDRKIKLLNYIKNKMINNNCCDYISKLENEEVLVLLDENEYEEIEETVYSRKRNINNK